MQALQYLLKQAESAIHAVSDLKELEDLRVAYLGKKGQLTLQLKELGKLPPSERPQAGQQINELKTTLLVMLEEKKVELNQVLIAKQLQSEYVDITLTGRTLGKGSMHPISQTIAELKHIFSRMGFLFMQGPEIETDYYNFTALNIPPFHPARAMQDTFYFENGKLLRSQMSPVQIHAMEKLTPPFRMAALGKVYRHDFDLTHTPMFHQMECLMVDEQVTFADLKGLLTYFLHEFFQNDAPVRFRPSYFPFTEPSAEVDMGCINCQYKGCRICKHTGWLEVLGCGMVHPNVLREVNIDPEIYRGFAFGVGIDRLTMLKFGIADLRSLFENDMRFLQQF